MDLEHQCIILWHIKFTNNIGEKYSHFILGAGGGHVQLQLLFGHGIDTGEVPDEKIINSCREEISYFNSYLMTLSDRI